MNIEAQKKRAQKTVDDWNDRFCVGQSVLVKKDFQHQWTPTKTRGEARVVSCEPVVWLEGITGCYSLKVVVAINEKS